MPINISAPSTVWNNVNYAGELFTADETNTPFLSMIGGLTGGGLETHNFEFPTDSQYDFPTAAQPAITETASLTAPTAISFLRNQSKNVTQIFHEKVSISYARLSNQSRMSGINTVEQENNVPNEKDFQIARALEHIARDAEYTCLNGAYQIATSAAVANKTRGLIELCTVNTVNASSATLTKALMDSLLLVMYTNGAIFKNCVIWCNGFQKQKISDVYGYAPDHRTIGGVNIQTIETDFGPLGIKLNRFMPAGTVLVAEMSVCTPVFQPVPDKGNFFYEELSKSGAAEEGQIFGQFGLAHGPAYLHGSLTSLATS
ncbi:MAG TPA: DUF5309 family protein [Candidatus Aquicultor sp.]|jgi:hypothetical protein